MVFVGVATPLDIVDNPRKLKIVELEPLGIVSSPGGLVQVPPQIPGAGQWKIVSWPNGEWYTVSLTPDGNGTYDVVAPTMMTL